MKSLLQLVLVVWVCSLAAAHGISAQDKVVRKKDYGQKYANMSDGQLWTEVMKCKNRKELQHLINRIPISVMAKHGIHATEDPFNDHRFGKFVNRVLWTESNATSRQRNLLLVHYWQDVTRRYERNASIFDVRELSVILEGEEGRQYEARIQRLSQASKDQVEVYQRLRKKFLDRLPGNSKILPALINSPEDDWFETAAAVFAIKSIDGLMEDVSFLVDSAGFPQAAAFFNLIAGAFLEGIDTESPLGLALIFIDEEPVVIGCLPVVDFEEVVETLENNGVDIEKDGDKWMGQVGLGFGKEVVVSTASGWANFSIGAKDFTNFPKNPANVFGALTDRDTLRLSVAIQNFPEHVRKEVVGFFWNEQRVILKEFIDRYEYREPNGWFDPTPPLVVLAHLANEISRVFTIGFKNPENMIRDANVFTIGWAVDRKKRSTTRSSSKRRSNGDWTSLELNLSALEGTRMAKRMAAARTSKSGFKGFVRPNSAFAIHVVADLLDEDKIQILELIKEYKERIDITTLEGQIAHQLLLVLNAVAESQKIDLAGSLLLEKGAVDFVLGFQVADGPMIEKLINNLMTTVKEGYEDSVEIQIDLNTEEHQRVNFHRIAVTLPKSQKKARRIFGEKAEFIIGVGPAEVFMGTGANAIESIKKGIDSSLAKDVKELDGLQVSFRMRPLIKFAADLEEELDRRKLLKKMLNSLSSNNDDVVVSLKSKDSSQKLRIEVKERVLGLIKMVLESANKF